MKAALTDFPLECRLLAVHFEETAAYHAEEYLRMKREQRQGGAGGDFHTDEVIGDDDEIDWSEAEAEDEDTD